MARKAEKPKKKKKKKKKTRQSKPHNGGIFNKGKGQRHGRWARESIELDKAGSSIS